MMSKFRGHQIWKQKLKIAKIGISRFAYEIFMRGLNCQLHLKGDYAILVLAFDHDLKFKVKHWPTFGTWIKFNINDWFLAKQQYGVLPHVRWPSSAVVCRRPPQSERLEYRENSLTFNHQIWHGHLRRSVLQSNRIWRHQLLSVNVYRSPKTPENIASDSFVSNFSGAVFRTAPTKWWAWLCGSPRRRKSKNVKVAPVTFTMPSKWGQC